MPTALASRPAIRASLGARGGAWRTRIVLALMAFALLGCASTRTPMPARLDGSVADPRQYEADKAECLRVAGLPEKREAGWDYAATAAWHRKEAVAGDCMHAKGWTLRR